MRILTLFLIMFAFGLLAAPAAQPAERVGQESLYICPMHPHITGSKGDTCPICGMSLVPKAAGSMTPPNEDTVPSTEKGRKTALFVEPVFMQALGVAIGEVTHRKFGAKIRASGRIAPRTQDEYNLSVRASGLIRDLRIAAPGQRVKKGDVLFTLYSRALMVAQQDYLARPAAAGAHRLRILGMDEAAIAALVAKKEVLYDVPFHAPVDGVVSSLAIRKGAAVEDGQSLVTLHDLGHVWAEAALPAGDLARVEASDTARIAAAGAIRLGRVDVVASEIDEATRTGAVRVSVDNGDGALRPGAFVDVIFETDARERLSVPSQAVLRDGRGSHVVKALGDGFFQSVPVQTGLSADGYTEILSGLSHGEAVVTSGQFLIDAESTLRGGMDRMQGPSEGKTTNAEGSGHVH